MKRSELCKLVKNIDACEDVIRDVVKARSQGHTVGTVVLVAPEQPGAGPVFCIDDPDLRDVAVDAIISAVAKRLENLKEQLMSVCPSIDLNC